MRSFSPELLDPAHDDHEIAKQWVATAISSGGLLAG
jgi:hypothetical protein